MAGKDKGCSFHTPQGTHLPLLWASLGHLLSQTLNSRVVETAQSSGLLDFYIGKTKRNKTKISVDDSLLVAPIY